MWLYCRLLAADPWASSREAIAHALMQAAAKLNTGPGAAPARGRGQHGHGGLHGILLASLNGLRDGLSPSAYEQLLSQQAWSQRVGGMAAAV